ncbi:MAG: beta-ketoacyl-[acyl-carrier-protein] synthase family protein [Deltaproteobacteria bacterium]|nr:beta-ketoacyl-[acyl-carrier-protein] synthase family protein [Deltaproteobacteria bacterium]
MRRVAVVSRGVYTPVGRGFDATWAGLLAGRGAVQRISRFDPTGYPVQIAAQVDLEGDGPALYDALMDAVLAEAMAGIRLDRVAPQRVGVFLGNEAVRPPMAELVRRAAQRELPTVEELARYAPHWQTLRVAQAVGALGATATHATACASSGMGLGEAFLAVRRGEVDVALAGGVDVLVHPLMVMGFARLGALSTRNEDPGRASRPFDLDRDGFVLGEGAALVVLAAEEVAAQVGTVLGWISGYGCSSNAWRITDSPPDGRGAAEAMEAALRDAGRGPGEVVYVNAHGTSTRQNDMSEARGIRRALGAHADRALVSSTKSMTAHMVAAGGAIEALVALEALRQGIAPPTINLDRVDPDCALAHVPWVPAPIPQGVAISNAFGFGGSNASIVVEAP